MRTLGILDEDRLMLLPDKYRVAHEFCFYLHDKLAQMLVEYDLNRVQDTVADAFEKVIVEAGQEDKFEDVDLLEYMKENELIEPYRHHLVSHTIMALTCLLYTSDAADE